MVEKNVTIVNKTGLHARPANGLVNLVKKYASRISLEPGSPGAGPR